MAVNGRVVAEAEIAADAGARTKGLLGRDGMEERDGMKRRDGMKERNGMDEKGNATDSVLVLEPAGWIHTLGMRFAIDVAYVDRRGRVLSVKTMKPWRVGMPRLRSRRVLEAVAGCFAKWNLNEGDQVEVKSEQAGFLKPDLPTEQELATGRTQGQNDSTERQPPK